MAYYNQGRFASPADYYNEQQKNQRGGIQNVLNMIMMLKQYKMNQTEKKQEQQRYTATQEQAQKKWGAEQQQQVIANQLAERGMVAEESRAESQRITAKRPTAISISTQRQAYADSLLKSGELSSQEYQQFKLTGTLPKKEGLTTFQQYSKKSTEMGRNQSYVRNKISDYGRGITNLKEPMSQSEMWAVYATGGVPDVKIDTEGIRNLESATRILSMLEMIVQDRPWTSDEKKILTYISGNRGRIQKEGLEAETSPSTGMTRVKIRGQWVIFK